ncbi:hypothetical protein BT63DRAFT_423887 [Microthyrium microscopicum]|uniref:Uncharacterized protein n=1 Tax=Microthyrium microscopicum TaxID=703497 RepID=A0A6A6UCN0_9PEZI|nr:hypothetical protein BT63DRAFT_423887 [Microthyrium microscopicum]
MPRSKYIGSQAQARAEQCHPYKPTKPVASQTQAKKAQKQQPAQLATPPTSSPLLPPSPPIEPTTAIEASSAAPSSPEPISTKKPLTVQACLSRLGYLNSQIHPTLLAIPTHTFLTLGAARVAALEAALTAYKTARRLGIGSDGEALEKAFREVEDLWWMVSEFLCVITEKGRLLMSGCSESLR